MAARRKKTSVRAELNDRMLVVLLLIAASAPLFFGSNRPVFWAFWGTIAGMVTSWWFLRMAKSDERLRIPVRKEPVIAGSFALLALYMLVQCLPLGGFLPPFEAGAMPNFQVAAPAISLTPGDTLLAFIRWITYGLLFFTATQLSVNTSRAERLVAGLYWVVVLHAVIGLAFRYQFGDTLIGIQKIAYIGSATAGFVNRNSFATFLAMGAVIGIALLFGKTIFANGSRDPKASKIDAYTGRGGVVQVFIGWLVILAALFATNSRMGLGATLAGMAAVLVLALLRMPAGSIRKPVWYFAGSMFAIALGLFLMHGQTVFERLGNTARDSDVRLDLYRQVLEMIAIRPFTGFGGNSFEYVYPLFQRDPVNIDFLWDKTHNTYLANWVDYGVIFGSLPLLICLVVVIRIVRDYLRRDTAEFVSLAALGVVVAAAVHSLADFSLEIQAVTFVFVLVLGAGFARATASLRTPEA